MYCVYSFMPIWVLVGNFHIVHISVRQYVNLYMHHIYIYKTYTLCPYLYPNHVLRIVYEFFGLARLPFLFCISRNLSSFPFCISSWTPPINILHSLSSLISCASLHPDPVSALGVSARLHRQWQVIINQWQDLELTPADVGIQDEV